METFAEQEITVEQALHDSMDCLRSAQKILTDLGRHAVAEVLRQQAEKNQLLLLPLRTR